MMNSRVSSRYLLPLYRIQLSYLFVVVTLARAAAKPLSGAWDSYLWTFLISSLSLKYKRALINVLSFRTGVRCDQCDINYFGNPLVPGGTCDACFCNNNIDPNMPGSCDASTGECLRCLYNSEGYNCEFCKPGFFGDATRQNCQGMFFYCKDLNAKSKMKPNSHLNIDIFTSGTFLDLYNTICEQSNRVASNPF